MFNKFAFAAAALALSALPLHAMEIRIVNHTQHRITDFWVNGFHHSMNTGPLESQWTGAYSENCEIHSLRAEASDGATWTGLTDRMCGDGIYTWHLRH